MIEGAHRKTRRFFTRESYETEKFVQQIQESLKCSPRRSSTRACDNGGQDSRPQPHAVIFAVSHDAVVQAGVALVESAGTAIGEVQSTLAKITGVVLANTKAALAESADAVYERTEAPKIDGHDLLSSRKVTFEEPCSTFRRRFREEASSEAMPDELALIS